MQRKKSLILIETMLAAFLVACVSLYLFRGYRLFLKASLKGRYYLEALIFLEEKNFQMESLEPASALADRVFSPCASNSDYQWGLEISDTPFVDLGQAKFKAGRRAGNKTIDSVVYFFK